MRSRTRRSTHCRSSTTRPTNTWTSLTSAQRTSPLYPQMFVLSDGRVIDVGPDTDHAHPDSGIVDVVDADDEPVRRSQRRHVPAEQDHEVRHVGRPRLRRPARLRHERPHRGARHERAEPHLARDVTDGARARVPQHDAAARRDGARERRQLALGRRRPDEVGAARRDLEPGHGDVDGGRLAAERASVPLDGAPAAGRPRADGRRRRGRRRHGRRRTARSTRRRTSSRGRGR